MTANTPRYLIESHGPDQEAIKAAFAGAFQLCKQNGISEITLLVPSKGSFPSGVVGTFLGEKIAKTLCKGEKIKIDNELSMNLESTKTFSSHRTYGMIMGIHLSQKDQDVLDSAFSTKAILLLPWTEDEGKIWVSTWNPTIIGKSTWQVQQTTLPPEVEDELIQLTHGINLSSGLTHPSDKESAKRTLSNIAKQGFQLQPDEFRRWALRHNWSPKHAEALGKLAARYFK